ncbi:hypothetical protein D3C74_239290 [compost metagenome]
MVDGNSHPRAAICPVDGGVEYIETKLGSSREIQIRVCGCRSRNVGSTASDIVTTEVFITRGTWLDGCISPRQCDRHVRVRRFS